MLLLGIDIGTSSIKVAIVDAASSKTLITVQYPDAEHPSIPLNLIGLNKILKCGGSMFSKPF